MKSFHDTRQEFIDRQKEELRRFDFHRAIYVEMVEIAKSWAQKHDWSAGDERYSSISLTQGVGTHNSCCLDLHLGLEDRITDPGIKGVIEWIEREIGEILKVEDRDRMYRCFTIKTLSHEVKANLRIWPHHGSSVCEWVDTGKTEPVMELVCKEGEE